MGAWEDGFAAGYREGAAHGIEASRRVEIVRKGRTSPRRSAPKKRAASAYSKRYGAAFKRLAPRYKKKSGGWKKDGFKRCSAAARKAAKK
tara:strand:+ start:717 stop:986 length:270 start_codon:yes stop_codon:yes gene_type:complete